MKRKRFLVVILFIIIAVVCFFVVSAIEDYIFLRYAPEDLISQLKYSFNLRLVLYGVYALLLVALSWGGFRISKRRGAVEYKIGFLYAGVISGLVLLTYLIALVVVLLG